MNVEPSFSPIFSQHGPLSSNHKQLDPISTSDFPTSRGKLQVTVSSPEQEMSAETETSVPVAPVLGKFLSPLLEQATKNGGGLSSVPQSTLQENLETVVSALERLDAEALLDLEIYPKQAQRSPIPGPRVRDGVYCRPINDQISPVVERLPHHSCVRYLHVVEIPDQYSIGIFVFGPNARIPLHDHPGMCVLSRVLYGDLIRLSLDLARPEEVQARFGREEPKQQTDSSWFSGSWFHRHFHASEIHNNLPQGSKAAFKNEIDHLQAPQVTVLYPYEGNLHEFVAGPHGAAVLDVLLPPYDTVENRDCTFYNIQNLPNGSHNADHNNNGSGVKFPKKEPCYIVPTGQPENFHCISGQYRDIGEQPNLVDDDQDEIGSMDESEYGERTL